MKALTFKGKQTIDYESVAEPKIETATDVIVQIKMCAICGSDLHPYHEREKGLDHSTIMGHEFVGEVVEAGRNVRNIQIGMNVFSPFTTNCGACYYCQKGLTCRCARGQLFGWRQNGQGLHGGQAEYVRVPMADSTLAEIPSGITFEKALLLGDTFSTGYFCADMAEVTVDGVYVVVGCGPVGLMAIIAARELGGEKLYAIDSVVARLEKAKQFGAIPLDFSKQDVVNEILEATDGRGADAVMEVVGSESAGRSAYDLVRPGGIISTVGVHTEKNMTFSPIEAYDKNIVYKAGRCPARYYMEKLLPIVQQSDCRIAEIITDKMKLKDGSQAYNIFDKKLNGCLKIVLEV